MSMKKSMYGLAAMAVAVSMASCSLDEVMEQPAQQAIGFSSFVGKPTKSVNETNTVALYNGFQVYGAYAADANVFNGVKVTSSDNGTSWTYANTQYWVPGQTYKFAAMGPSGDDINNKLSFDYSSGHLKLTDYEVTNLASDSKDLVYDNETRTTKNPLETTDYADVSLTFGHIMSWIKVKFVHDMTSGYKITISDVTVSGVKTKGTFNGTGWTMNESPSDAEFKDQDPHSYNQTDNILDENQDYCLVDFIAIPQPVTTLDISFKLTVQDSKGNYLVGSKDTPKEVSATQLTSVQWQQDYVYTYTAELDESVLGLYPIKFTASVNSWTNTNNNTDLTFSTGSN